VSHIAEIDTFVIFVAAGIAGLALYEQDRTGMAAPSDSRWPPSNRAVRLPEPIAAVEVTEGWPLPHRSHRAMGLRATPQAISTLPILPTSESEKSRWMERSRSSQVPRH
jgi:hypothetical protein